VTILCIAQDGHFVVIEVNLVDQHIDQPLRHGVKSCVIEFWILA